jgi:S1-C subfamily serine protease
VKDGHGARTLILLGFALAVLVAGVATVPADEPRVERKDRVSVVIVDEDGDRHEEVYEFDGDNRRPFLGVRLGRADEGVHVESVIEGTAAERAGLREGDVIVEFDGTPVETPWDLTREVLRSERGQRVDLEVIRDGARQTVTAEIGESEHLHFGPMPFDFDFDFDFDAEAFHEQMEKLHELGEMDFHFEWDAEGFAEQMERLGEQLGEMDFEFDFDAEEFGEQMRHMAESLENMEFDFDDHGRRQHHWVGTWGRPLLGVELVETTPELRRHLGADGDSGVLVGKVLSGMPAERAGVRVGDLIVSVDGEPIEDGSDLRRALRDRRGEIFDVEVIRDGSPTSLTVEIPEAEERDGEDPRGSGQQPTATGSSTTRLRSPKSPSLRDPVRSPG